MSLAARCFLPAASRIRRSPCWHWHIVSATIWAQCSGPEVPIMSSTAISRRHALQWLAALGISLAGQGTVFAHSASCPLASDLDAQAVRALGREFLSLHPNDAQVAAITALLSGAGATG